MLAMTLPPASENLPESTGGAEVRCQRLPSVGRWRAAELRAVVEFLLSAPIVFQLGGLEASREARLREACEAEGSRLWTLRDLLQHPEPPLELLRMAKDYAKAGADHPVSPLPEEAALALYYASIAAALVRRNFSISRLSDDELYHGFDWAAQQPWLDEASRRLLREARKGTGRRASSPRRRERSSPWRSDSN